MRTCFALVATSICGSGTLLLATMTQLGSGRAQVFVHVCHSLQRELGLTEQAYANLASLGLRGKAIVPFRLVPLFLQGVSPGQLRAMRLSFSVI